MIEVFWQYLQITGISFLLNIIPAFAPPTWIVLSLYKISNPTISSLIIAFFGVIGSVAGRVVMYYYSSWFRKYLPKKDLGHLNYLKKIEKGKGKQLFILTFLYSLSPFPSNFIFIASGISGIEIIPVITGFGLGRFISYSLLVYGVFQTSSWFGILGMGNIRIIADISGVILSILIVLVDWKKVHGKIKNMTASVQKILGWKLVIEKIEHYTQN
jgi:membrane protein YqaA with SNARE-associated domain